MRNASSVRDPAVAGAFYPASSVELLQQIEHCYLEARGPGAVPSVRDAPLDGVVGLILPHAGYAYSGAIAAHGMAALARLGRPERIVILGPNHYGVGPGLALPQEGAWWTPLGHAPVDGRLVEGLLKAWPILSPSSAAHRYEHSMEVMLPFLIHLLGSSPPFVAIAMADQSLETSLSLGEVLAATVSKGSVLVIASTDLSHYYPQDIAQEKDGQAIEAIIRGSPQGVNEVVEGQGVNMCGPGPVMALLAYMGRIGLSKIDLLAHGTSGDASEDYSRVVGYAALLLQSKGS
ncbi:MAG: AmmeMemoRadiSam system protein B [Chloroflexi bacterium]|nr:AmmeMemoRadiSam system protein B [Chloroflexota bacterium]